MYSSHCVSLTYPVPHSYCGRTCNKCPTADPHRDPTNCGIFLVLVLFFSLATSDASFSPSYWSRRLPANTAPQRGGLLQRAAVKTEFSSFPCRKAILEISSKRSQSCINIVCHLQSQLPQRSPAERWKRN